MRNFLILCITHMLLLSCSQATRSLDTDEIVREVFDKEEIIALNKFVARFEQYLLNTSDCGKSDVNMCFQAYISNLRRYEQNGDLIIEITEKDKMKWLNDLNIDLVKEIWIVPDILENTSIHSKYLYFNLEGKYIRFLEAYSKQNEKVKYASDEAHIFRLIASA